MEAASVGKRIAELRKQEGLTQKQLADKLGVSNKAISKWETGEGFPDITMIPKLSAIFNVSSDYLLSKEVEGAAGAMVQYRQGGFYDRYKSEN